MKVYKVGGAIRDKILKLKVEDSDYVVVGSNEEEMIKKGFRKVGKDFPVFLHPKTNEEYALARKERNKGFGHKAFDFDFSPEVSLEEDLKRRDITINAIAEDEDGNLIDPYGGIDDLKNGVIRHVSSAFIEDPLRALRLARFYAKFDGFLIHDDTKAILQKISQSNELDYLSGERVWEETLKALNFNFTRFLKVITDFNLQEPWFCKLIQIPNMIDQRPEIALSQVNQANKYNFCLKLRKHFPKKILQYLKVWKQIEQFNKNSTTENKFLFFSSFLGNQNKIIFLEIIEYFNDKKEYCSDIINEIGEIDFSDLSACKHNEIEKIKKKKILKIIRNYE
jgi:tRNA nucleotidyltransferase/poly(A) polymerase